MSASRRWPGSTAACSTTARRCRWRKSDIETVLAAADLDWSEIDPSILGTLFERGLVPGKRAQLGDKIMLLVEPVVIRPLLVEWEAEKTAIAAELDRAEAAKSSAARTKRRRPSAGCGRFSTGCAGSRCSIRRAASFLYFGAAGSEGPRAPGAARGGDAGLPARVPSRRSAPANVKGIELNPYAAELARVSVWIGEIQGMRRNGFAEERNPIIASTTRRVSDRPLRRPDRSTL